MDLELSEFEQKLSDDERKEKEKADKRLAALNKRKEDMIKEKKQKNAVSFPIAMATRLFYKSFRLHHSNVRWGY